MSLEVVVKRFDHGESKPYRPAYIVDKSVKVGGLGHILLKCHDLTIHVSLVGRGLLVSTPSSDELTGEGLQVVPIDSSCIMIRGLERPRKKEA